ncbi:MAG: enoyl-CoA hydratase [Mycobacterium sp.]|jgi:enoyl-CoA hydratase|uniref:enoyl-CoA hydratase/isomerase family protein n=1 Tax=Mycobacterium sp. TaxID=1785 RepID=UPI0028B9F795|nr:enoyl-CoA hydratase [Mycobacterium sp.]
MPIDEVTAALEVRVLDEHVREIVLTRPEVLNRVDEQLHHELIDALREVSNDPTTRAVVLSSQGPAFSAGGDFEMMRKAHSDSVARRQIIDTGRALATAFFSLPQPIIAAVQGPAIGLGATLVLSCDAVVAARSASLADPHVRMGLVAGDGGCVVWPAAAGMLRARRHLLTGDALSAETAYTLGLVTDLVDDAAQVPDAALAIARSIAAAAPLAVQGTKRALNRVTNQRAGEVLDLSFALEEHTLASPDLMEAIAAFQEKRTPTFRGR